MSDLVLLPAFPLTSAVWAGPAAALTAAGHRVLTPDQRGFGDTPLGADEPSLDVLADDVARLLDAEGLARVVVGGVSMGGYVAMALLRRHPERVAGLALVDTKATADPPAARENRERIARTVLAESGPRVLLAEVLPTLLGPTTAAERPDVVAAVRGMVEQAPPDAVAWAQRAMAARPDSTGALRAADLPALVVVGEQDALAPVAEARAMLAALPRGRLVTVPRAGHLTPIEAPDAVAAALADFLTGVAAGRL